MTPYTPQTVKYIAACSGICTPEQIAQELGWPVDSLERIARRHEIDLCVSVNGLKQNLSASRPTPAAVSARSAPRKPAFTFATTADEISYVLRGQARDVFDVLRRDHCGGFLEAREIALRAFLTPEQTMVAIFKVKMRLVGSRFYVEKAMGWRGGYRLAELRR